MVTAAAPSVTSATAAIRGVPGAGATATSDAAKNGSTAAMATDAPPARARWSGSHGSPPPTSAASTDSDRKTAATPMPPTVTCRSWVRSTKRPGGGESTGTPGSDGRGDGGTGGRSPAVMTRSIVARDRSRDGA